MSIGIYKISNIANNKCYIGQSIEIENHINSYFSALKNNRHGNSHLQYSWNKYEKESFKMEILEIIEENENMYQNLDEREIYWINYYNSSNPKFGYNKTTGGQFKRQLTKETKEKISKANKGRIVSDETRKKIGKAHKGKKLSEKHIELLRKRLILRNNKLKGTTLTKEHKEKVSCGLKEYYSKNKVSKETRIKLSNALKGKKPSEKTKEKMRIKALGRPSKLIGSKLSEETKKKVSEGLKKYYAENPISEETKQKMSENRKGEKHPNYGKKLSKETREKISKSHANVSGENNPMYGKKMNPEIVKQLNITKRNNRIIKLKELIILKYGYITLDLINRIQIEKINIKNLKAWTNGAIKLQNDILEEIKNNLIKGEKQ